MLLAHKLHGRREGLNRRLGTEGAQRPVVTRDGPQLLAERARSEEVEAHGVAEEVAAHAVFLPDVVAQEKHGARKAAVRKDDVVDDTAWLIEGARVHFGE